MPVRLLPTLVGVLAIAVLVSGWRVLRTPTPSANGQVLGQQSREALAELVRPPVVTQPTLTDEPISIQARSGVVLDAGSGRLLLAKAEHEPVPIASTTKVMTAVVLLRSGRSLDELVTISPAATKQIGSTIGLRSGESLSLRDLLFGLMVVSGNDAAYAIAEAFGSVETFVTAMNRAATEIGLVNTRFVDPAGLDDRGQSSPFDLAMLLRYALTYEEFREAASTAERTLISSAGNRYELTNSNRLVRPDQPLYLPDVIAGKTGFTPDAGHCLVAAARRDGHVLISAVLHTADETPEASAAETRRLIDWTFNHTEWRTIK